jgi:hypothetical protein
MKMWASRSSVLMGSAGNKVVVLVVPRSPQRRSYHELGGNYLEHINRDQLQRYFAKRLQKLGLTVTVAPAA